MKDKFKIIIIVLFLTLCALSFIGGCSSSYKSISYYKNRAAKYDLNRRLPQLLSSKNTNESIEGGYYFTYIPLLFCESEDIRKARHQYLRSHFYIMLRHHGLFPEEFEKAKYNIQYNYFTYPSTDGTFYHNFTLDINEREEGKLFTTKTVWWGRISIEETTSSDISLYFDTFMFKILKGFPEPQNTMKDFLESMQE